MRPGKIFKLAWIVQKKSQINQIFSKKFKISPVDVLFSLSLLKFSSFSLLVYLFFFQLSLLPITHLTLVSNFVSLVLFFYFSIYSNFFLIKMFFCFCLFLLFFYHCYPNPYTWSAFFFIYLLSFLLSFYSRTKMTFDAEVTDPLCKSDHSCKNVLVQNDPSCIFVRPL